MAQTAYVVNLMERDELSKTIVNVKTRFKEAGKAADRLDEIQK